MAVFLRLALVPIHDTALGGFILAILYACAAQFLLRRAVQTKDPGQRVARPAGLRSMLAPSTALAAAGVALSVMLLFVLAPARMSVDMQAGRFLSMVLSRVGLLLTPFAFAARRIRWLSAPA